MFFNSAQYNVFLIGSDVAEVIIEEEVFSYTQRIEPDHVAVRFPGGIYHDSFGSHEQALDEIARIWLLIREAENNMRNTLRKGVRQ